MKTPEKHDDHRGGFASGDLLGCPWCGQPPRIMSVERDVWQAFCETVECPAEVSVAANSSKRVIELWNERKLVKIELAEMRKALDELHVVIECAPGDVIHDWYCTDPLASQARDNAVAILTRRVAGQPNEKGQP